MKLHRIIAPLALVITPGIVLAQQGRDTHPAHPDRDGRRAGAVVVQQPVMPPQQRAHERVREEAGSVDPRFVQPNSAERARVERAERPAQSYRSDRSYQSYQVNPRLSHGDVTRSLRADERANDVEAHSHSTKHHRKHHKH